MASSGLIETSILQVAKDERKIFDSTDNLFAIVLTTDFNCKVRIASDLSHFDIAINLGFLRFYNEMSKMLLSRINVISETEYKSKKYKRNKGLSFEQTVAIARTHLEAFWNNELPKHNSVSVNDLDDGTAHFYRLILVQGLRFSIAHELSHIIFKISPKNRTYLESGQNSVKLILKDVPTHMFKEKWLSDIIENWGHEFAADHLGLELAINTEKTEIYKEFQFFAAEWLFILMDMLWRYYAQKHGGITLTTHPAPFMRFERLKNSVNPSQGIINALPTLQDMVKKIVEASI